MNIHIVDYVITLGDNMSSELPNNYKIILQQNTNIPIEDLLGSVTTYNNVEGSDTKSLQLRTSARVFKKMKLDSANAATTATPEKKEPAKEEIKPEVRKSNARPLWSQEDKNLFFEALNEFGKDFEAIHLYISNKLRKKGVSENMIKTKEQMRHLYYRTWHKISKHLRFSDEVKKIAQELYGLINYGELRKKLSIISEKTCIKLNELIYRGSVAIRVKGKTIRIKTPMCKALRKLNQLDEKENDLKLPARVTVELVPKNMNTWLHIQNMSQNPRVRTVLPLQKRLSSLLMCMTDRWKSQCVAEFEKTFQSFKETINGDTQLLHEIEEENKFITDPLLRFSPPKSCNIEVPTLNLSEYLTNQSICLNAYEERFGIKTSGEQLWLTSYPNSCRGSSRKSAVKRARQESSSEKTSPANKLATTTDNNENCLNDNDLPSSINDVVDDAVNTLLGLQQQESASSSDEKQENTDVKVEVIEEDKEKRESDIAKIRKGWTLLQCGTLSIGDIYLMFGSDSKLVLEYSWDKTEIKKDDDSTERQKVNSNNEIDNDLNSGVIESIIHNPNSLSVTLKRLLSVAKLHYRKNRIQCPCGHICGNSSKQNTNKTKAITGAITKNLTVTTSKEKFYNNQEKPVSVQQHGEVLMIQSLNAEPHIRRLSPSILFRRPSSPNDILRAQLDSIQRLKPRYCNRRGRRPRSKPVVVERKLPILANKGESGRQIVQMNIISQDNLSPTQRPIMPKIQFDNEVRQDSSVNRSNTVYGDGTVVASSTTVVASNTFNNEIIQSTKANELRIGYASGTGNAESDAEARFSGQILPDKTENIDISDNATTPSRVGSPTSISNLLQMALNSHCRDEVMQTCTIKEDGSISFVGLLSQNAASGSTPPTSPSRILKENENQWLNAEVGDFSLSSFLGHLDSPMKTTQANTGIGNDDTRLSLTQDVDAHLQSLLTESSLDYTAKFADLAAQVTDTKK